MNSSQIFAQLLQEGATKKHRHTFYENNGS